MEGQGEGGGGQGDRGEGEGGGREDPNPKETKTTGRGVAGQGGCLAAQLRSRRWGLGGERCREGWTDLLVEPSYIPSSEVRMPARIHNGADEIFFPFPGLLTGMTSILPLSRFRDWPPHFAFKHCVHSPALKRFCGGDQSHAPRTPPNPPTPSSPPPTPSACAPLG